MLVYVDDIVIAGSHLTAVDRLVQSIFDTFSVKDIGTHNNFFDLEVASISRELLLTQHKYALDLLHRSSM